MLGEDRRPRLPLLWDSPMDTHLCRSRKKRQYSSGYSHLGIFGTPRSNNTSWGCRKRMGLLRRPYNVFPVQVHPMGLTVTCPLLFPVHPGVACSLNIRCVTSAYSLCRDGSPETWVHSTSLKAAEEKEKTSSSKISTKGTSISKKIELCVCTWWHLVFQILNLRNYLIPKKLEASYP